MMIRSNTLPAGARLKRCSGAAIKRGARFHRAKARWKRAPRGSILLETTVAIIILGAAMVAVAHTVATLAVQRQSAERQTLATQEAANLMERLFVLPADDITAERVSELQLSPSCHDRLPDAKLDITIEPAGLEPTSKKIGIQIEWTGHGGMRSPPVRLTAWKYAKEEAGE